MKRYTYIHILSLLFLLTILFIESCEKPVRVLSIKTLDVPSEDITFENVVMKGELVDLGEDPIYNHGILIKPVSESDFIQMGEGETSNTGTFVTNFPNPTLGTNYEYKAFAETNNKVFYGELKSFISNNASIPAIKTNPFGDFTTTWVQSGGDITGDGGAPITARGVCWSTSSNPTTDDFSVEHASQGTGHFDLQINGLTPATEYFIKAFATNIAGTAYGNEVIFTTGWDVPSLETSGVTNITDVSCDVGGENIVENGQSINDKGVCWSTSPNPEITDSFLSAGVGGTSGFLIFISPLNQATEYYARAYATNNMGTGYGNELTFTTDFTPADVTTNAVSEIEATSANLNGTVSSSGGTTLIDRGFFYGTSSDLELNGTKVSVGGVLGDYSQLVNNLSINSTYYYAAYAENQGGITLGDVLSFNTDDPSQYIYSVIGEAVGGWDTDVDFTFISFTGSTYTYQIANLSLIGWLEFKIRRDHDWIVNYGWGEILLNGHNFFDSSGNFAVSGGDITYSPFTLRVDFGTNTLTFGL